MQSLFPTLLTALVSTQAFLLPHPPIALEQAAQVAYWTPVAGDRIVVDTKENIGYLIHPSGEYAYFPVATGQNRTVTYIGRTYKATTPAQTWYIGSKEKKGDKITFGPSGRFLRLYEDQVRTPYGFHEYANEDYMFGEEDRFKSMGCIIVKSFVLDILEKTLDMSDGYIRVDTIYGFDPGDATIISANI